MSDLKKVVLFLLSQIILVQLHLQEKLMRKEKKHILDNVTSIKIDFVLLLAS